MTANLEGRSRQQGSFNMLPNSLAYRPMPARGDDAEAGHQRGVNIKAGHLLMAEETFEEFVAEAKRSFPGRVASILASRSFRSWIVANKSAVV
jgi:hypothetical protein